MSNTSDKMKEGIHDAAEKVKDVAHDVGEKVKDAAHDVAEKTKDAAHNVAEKTKDIVRNVGEKIKDAGRWTPSHRSNEGGPPPLRAGLVRVRIAQVHGARNRKTFHLLFCSSAGQ